MEKYGYCVIVVSEGVHDPDGKFLAEAGTKDAFGHAQLGGVGPVVAQMTQEAFGYKFHWAVADYLQRSARHIASKVDVEQAYAVGKAAVELAPQRQERGDARHRPQVLQTLSLEHRRSAPSPRSPTRKKRCRATSSPRMDSASPRPAARYLSPLIGGEDYPPYRNGLPTYVTLKGVSVAEAPAHPVCGIVASLFLAINSYFSIT